MTRASAFLVAMLACSIGEAEGQTVRGGAGLEAYGFSESSALRLRGVRLLTLPFEGRVPLLPDAQVAVHGAYATATAELPSGASSTLSGLVDTRVSLDARLGGLMLRAAALLPTGDVIQSSAEASMVGLLSNELLPFGITQWGTGGGFAGDVGYVARIGEASVLLMVGGSALMDSKPLASGTVYTPGRQVRGRAVIDSPVGEASVFSVLLGYQHFEVDTYEDRNLFSPGARVEGALSYAFPVGARESALAFVAVHHLEAGVSELSSLGSITLPGVADRSARTLLVGGGELHLARGRHDFVPRGDLRLLRRADGYGQGWLASVGGRAEIRPRLTALGRGWSLEPEIFLRAGRIVAGRGVSSTVFGGEVGMALRWQGTR